MEKENIERSNAVMSCTPVGWYSNTHPFYRISSVPTTTHPISAFSSIPFLPPPLNLVPSLMRCQSTQNPPGRFDEKYYCNAISNAHGLAQCLRGSVIDTVMVSAG
jgi:hypothetical protein